MKAGRGFAEFQTQIEAVKYSINAKEQERDQIIKKRLMKFFHYQNQETQKPLEPYYDFINRQMNMTAKNCIIVFGAGISLEVIKKKLSIHNDSVKVKCTTINKSNHRILFLNEEVFQSALKRFKFINNLAEDKRWVKCFDFWNNFQHVTIEARYATVYEANIREFQENIPQDKLIKQSKEIYERDILNQLKTKKNMLSNVNEMRFFRRSETVDTQNFSKKSIFKQSQ